MKIDDPGATIQSGTARPEAQARTASVRDVDFQKCAVGLHVANLPPLQTHYSAWLRNDYACVRLKFCRKLGAIDSWRNAGQRQNVHLMCDHNLVA